MQKFKCVGECKREFGAGQWECFPGEKHRVETKAYYLDDAPALDAENDRMGIAFRSSRTNVHVIPETIKTDGLTGQTVRSNHPPAVFVMGKFETDDPEYQYYLDKSKIDVGYERWFQVYHTPLQKQNLREAELAAKEVELEQRKQRIEREENALLARVKKDAKLAGVAAQ